MRFSPIEYEDFSHLNARWQEERPAVAGLGDHHYVDVSFLNARLRPILPAGVGMGNGILSKNALGIVAGLGEDPAYPWREYSADTKALQETTNDALRAHGFNPITADGKLGPATCGAIKAMCAYVDTACEAPGTCQSFTAPTKVGSGGGGGGGGTALPRSSTASMIGGGSNYLMIGGAVAAMAVGGALIYRAMKKR